MMSGNDRDDEKVGPGHPPKHAQFQKGKSGNPRGRPSGRPTRRDFREATARVIDNTLTVYENGQPCKISVLEGVLRRLVQMALDGNIHAIKLFLDWIVSVAEDDQPVVDHGGEAAGDIAILARFGLSSSAGAPKEPRIPR